MREIFNRRYESMDSAYAMDYEKLYKLIHEHAVLDICQTSVTGKESCLASIVWYSEDATFTLPIDELAKMYLHQQTSRFC